MKKSVVILSHLVRFSPLLLVPLFIIRYQAATQMPIPPAGGIIIGTIADEPVITSGKQTFTFNGWEIMTRRYPEYHYGDRIQINLKNQISNLKTKSQISKIQYPEIIVIDRSRGNPILAGIYRFRGRVEEVYQEILPEPEAGLLTGIVLGVKSNLPYDFNEALKNTGTIHVVVASGTNITFVTGFLVFFLNRFLGRRRAISLSFLGIIFYMALAGFSPPIVRAGLMGIIVLTAQILGRQSMGTLSLLITTVVMLFVQPLYLSDIGFQLSVAATAGLLFVGPIIREIKALKFIMKIPILGEGFGTTISAQIATTPILLFHFGRISLLSPLVNALILWIVPFVMVLGAVTGMIGIAGNAGLYAAQYIGYFTYGFLFYFTAVVRFFNTIPGGLINWEHSSGLLITGYYLILLSILFQYFLLKNRRRNQELDRYKTKSKP